MPPCPPPPSRQRELPTASPETGEVTADDEEANETNRDQEDGRSENPTRDEPYDEALLTPYVSRYGRRSIPVEKYQAGVSPSVSEMKHKYELFLQRKGREN